MSSIAAVESLARAALARSAIGVEALGAFTAISELESVLENFVEQKNTQPINAAGSVDETVNFTFTAAGAGKARVWGGISFTAQSVDDIVLVELVRDIGTGGETVMVAANAPAGHTTADGAASLTWTDTGNAQSSTHTYSIRATGPGGHTVSVPDAGLAWIVVQDWP